MRTRHTVRTHAVGMVFLATALAAPASPAASGFIGVELQVSGGGLAQERMKLLVKDGATSSMTLEPEGGGPRYRFTLVAKTGLPANAPPQAGQLANPITLSLTVDTASASEPWAQLTRNWLLLSSGGNASMVSGEPAQPTLAIAVSARTLSDAEATAVRAGSAQAKPEPAPALR